jgi:hypothetical protein
MARKKYYQSKKDRKKESRGMKAYEDTRKMEKSGVEAQIYSDYNAPANLPQEVIHENYPKTMYLAGDRYLGDSLHGIDKQMDADVSEARKHLKPEKY